MTSSREWSQDEQGRLEEGILKSIAIIDFREKWKAVALVVRTRSARECADRFQACRNMSHAAKEGSTSQASESDEPGERVDDNEAFNDSHESAWKWKEDRTWNNSDWKGGWWKREEKWKANWWESTGSWENEPLEKEQVGVPEIESLDENERRAMEARNEVEANRERMRLREERLEQQEKHRAEKAQKEIDEKRKKHLEHVAAKEKEFQDAVAKKEAIAAQQTQRALEAKREAERTDVPFFGQQNKAVLPKAGWAAKAGASKGEIQRQKKQAEMDRKAAEVLANLGIKQPDCHGDESKNNQQPALAPSSSSSSSARAIPSPPQQTAVQTTTNSTNSATGNVAMSRIDAKKKQQKRWWEKLDSSIVCPISLAPICDLPRAPFQLETEGSADPHYFDARFLANFLVSAFDFIDPVNRRTLTQDECRALDIHLQRNHPEDPGAAVSVADAFALFTQNRRSGADASDARVQREATAVLQHLFRFQSARRTDQRGRAIHYASAGLTVVDDDDILVSADQPPPSDRDRHDEAEESEAFPELGNSTSGGQANTSRAWLGRAQGSSYPSAEEAFPVLGGAKASSKAKAPPPKAATAKPQAAQSKGRGGGRVKQQLRAGPKGWGAPT